MTPNNDEHRDLFREGEPERYDPFEFVPDRVDQVTASGLVELHEALNDRNRARLESVPIETQGLLLWKLVEKGHIDLSVGGRR